MRHGVMLLVACLLAQCAARSTAPHGSVDASPSSQPGSSRAPIDSPASEESPAERDSMAPSQRLLAMHPPTDAETVLPSANEVTGVWHDVPATAPPGPFRRPPPCYEGLGWFAFEQRGTEVAMLRRFAEPAQGIKPVERVDQYEYARGERRGDAIELAGELVRETTPTEEPGPTRREILTRPRWSLTFDRATGHLMGKRDGAGMRLAPLVIVSPPGDPTQRDRCGSPPP